MSKPLHEQVAVALLLALPGVAAASPDHYIYDADVELFDDFDGDGFYRFVSVRIDADSYSEGAWVYAELYLSADGTTWEHYHSTGDFWISGATGDDEFFVETELVSGYPSGYYDLLIELYDADFGTYSDEFGPYQSDGMSLLPLEDATQDPEPVQVTVVDGGGGAFAWIWLPALLLAGGGLTAQPRRRRV
ncbi:MAG: choice-of-anchor H family protein [Gammaproteobacteria bacterium]|jgi:hypothetical protein